MPKIDASFVANIAASGTTSEAIDMKNMTLVGMYLPAALTSTALTFLACDTAAGTFLPVRVPAGTALSVTVAAAQYIPVDPTNFLGVRFLKLVFGSSEAAARVIRLMGKEIHR